jgi:hypothetical protein
MRSALTRHVMEVGICASRCASVTLVGEVTVRPPSRSGPLLIGWFVASGLAGFVAWPVIVPPDPSSDPKERQTYGTAPDGPPFSAALLFGAEHFAIGAEGFRAGRFGRWYTRLRSIGSIRNWYPAGDERKSLRRTVRASLRVVNFVAIEAEAGGLQLHGLQCTRFAGGEPVLAHAPPLACNMRNDRANTFVSSRVSIRKRVLVS